MCVSGNEPSPTEVAELAEPEQGVDPDKAAFTESQIHEVERMFGVQDGQALSGLIQSGHLEIINCSAQQPKPSVDEELPAAFLE